jgi:hypothetical protein
MHKPKKGMKAPSDFGEFVYCDGHIRTFNNDSITSRNSANASVEFEISK